MARYEKVCPRCGTKFGTDSARRKYCYNGCSYEMDLERRYERQQVYNEEHKKKKERKEKVMKLFREKSIGEIGRDARKAGMTYGQYVAQQWCQEEIAQRKVERAMGIRFLDRFIKKS